MSTDLTPYPKHESPFQRIRRVNAAGNEFWSSRQFAEILGYTDYRNFEQVIHRAKTACFNSGQRIEDHFVDVTEMIATASQAFALTQSVRFLPLLWNLCGAFWVVTGKYSRSQVIAAEKQSEQAI